MAIVVGNPLRGRKCPKCGVPNKLRARRCVVCGGMISKHLNQKVQMDGYTFDSKREANRYMELKMLEKMGQLRELIIHPRFELVVNGVNVCSYVADFEYRPNWQSESGRIVEDAKGKRTRDYILKKKLMAAIYNITVEEI
jgi:hypothetical protein